MKPNHRPPISDLACDAELKLFAIEIMIESTKNHQIPSELTSWATAFLEDVGMLESDGGGVRRAA